MRTNRFWVLAALVAASIVFSSAEAVTTKADIAAAIDAIKRGHCIAEFRGFRGLPGLTEVLYVFVRSEGDTSYAWLEGLDLSAGKDRIANFYAIERRNGKSAVGQFQSFNTAFMQDDPEFRNAWKHVFGEDRQPLRYDPDLQVGELRVPFECAIVLEPDTPLKRRMVDTIQKSIANALTQSNRSGISHYPARVKIAIGDFDTDFSDTYVLVLETGKLFSVYLHDLDDPLGDSLLERGEYEVWPVNYHPGYEEYMAPVRQKMIAAGIKREIRIRK